MCGAMLARQRFMTLSALTWLGRMACRYCASKGASKRSMMLDRVII